MRLIEPRRRSNVKSARHAKCCSFFIGFSAHWLELTKNELAYLIHKRDSEIFIHLVTL